MRVGAVSLAKVNVSKSRTIPRERSETSQLCASLAVFPTMFERAPRCIGITRVCLVILERRHSQRDLLQFT